MRRAAAVVRLALALVVAHVVAATPAPAEDPPSDGGGAAAADAVEHRLPFPAGESHTVWQGNAQRPSHDDEWNRYAFDFSPLPEGSLVCASADGVVVLVKEDTSGPTGKPDDNNRVVVRHADGRLSECTHLRKDGAIVETGDRVVAGDLIGYSGNTGASTLPHLHFNLRTRDAEGPSAPIRFADVPGGGVPKTGDVVRSGNVAARDLPGFRALRSALDLLAFCEELGVAGAAVPLLAPARKGLAASSHPSVAALAREADAASALRRAAGKEAAANVRAALGSCDVEALADFVLFAPTEFAGEPVAKEVAAVAREAALCAGYADAVRSRVARIAFHDVVSAAAKAEAAAQAKFRPPKQADPAARPDFKAAIAAWTRSAKAAPSEAEASAIERHVVWLRRAP